MISPLDEHDDETIKRKLGSATRNAANSASPPQHVRHRDLKHLTPSLRGQRLIIDHTCGSSWFRCVCGVAVSWTGEQTDKQRLSSPVIIPFHRGSGVLRGECPNCGNIHWKKGSVRTFREALERADLARNDSPSVSLYSRGVEKHAEREQDEMMDQPLEELAACQGVQPILDFDALLGRPSEDDESVEEFAQMLREWRREKP
jgi:hypothetical protein